LFTKLQETDDPCCLAAADLPVRCVVEVPDQVIPRSTATFAVRGWAIGPAQVVEVTVALDGVVCGIAELRRPRPDVAAAFPSYAEAAHSGFVLRSARLPPGHGNAAALQVTVRFANGQQTVVERILQVPANAADVVRALSGAAAATAEPLLGFIRDFLAAGLAEDAEALAGLAVARFPDNGPALAIFAEVAGSRKDVNEATRRLAHVQARFPELLPSGLGEAKRLADAGRLAEAEVVLERLVHAGNTTPGALEQRAFVTERLARQSKTGDRPAVWARAARAWDALVACQPDSIGGLIGAGRARLQTNRMTEAETWLGAAYERFPAEPMLAVLHAEAATQRGDWLEGVRRWDALRERFPGFEGGQGEERFARFNAAGEQQVLPATPVARLAKNHATSHHELALRFEAFGSFCEFGAVQRAMGTEPLGLLRFSSGSAIQLISALESGFAGVGEIANTVFELVPEPRPEYWLIDRCYGFRSHTFIYPESLAGEAERATLLAKHCRRLQFLRRKLLDDLRVAEKILVHTTHQPFDAATRTPLFRAVRAYGPNVLLCVVPADETHPAGTLETMEPGLLIGRVDGFVNITRDTLDMTNWLSVLLAAADTVVSRS
jgi:hypothetical protein